MDERQKQQSDINAQIAAYIPSDAWDSTVAIVQAKKPSVCLLGTGILFQISDVRFVITAAHVIRYAHEFGKTLGISDACGSFVSVPGNWISSAPFQFDSIEDPFDVAVYRLPDRAVQRLSGKRFLSKDDLDFSDQSPTTVFSVFGYPGIWTLPSRASDEKLVLRPLEYTTYAYDGSTEALTGYCSKYHLLLGASPEENTMEDGSMLVFKDRQGETGTLRHSLAGISGCCVWAIGDLDIPADCWCNRKPKVVAVETGVYEESKVIRATRWVAVTTLIHEAFQDFRDAIESWTF
ncbi:MAG: hypothetical protein WC975_04845 [Phycisphaerae bacterium]